MPASWRGRKRTGPRCSSIWTRDAVTRTSCNLCWICFHCWHALLCEHQAQCCCWRQSEVEEVGMFLVGRSRQKTQEVQCIDQALRLGWSLFGMKVSPSSFWTLSYVDWLCVRVLFSFRSLFFGTTVRPMLVFSRTVLDDCIIVIRQANHTEKLAQEESGVGPLVIELNYVSPSQTVSSLFHVRRLCGCWPWCCWFGKPGSLHCRSMNCVLSSTLGSRSRIWKMLKCGEYVLERRAWIFLTLGLWKKLLISLPGAHSTVHCGAGCWFSCATDRGRDLRGYAAAHRWTHCPGAASWALLLLWTGINLDQRIAEHERRIQEDRLPEQVAQQAEDAPANKRKKGRLKQWAVDGARDGMTDFNKSMNIGEPLLQSPALQAAGYEVLSLTGTDPRSLRCASIGVYWLCGGDVCVQLTLQNYVDASWTRRKTVSLAFVCLHAEVNSFQLRPTSPQAKQHYCLRHTLPCVEVVFLLCWLGNWRALHKKRLTSSLKETSPLVALYVSGARECCSSQVSPADDHETWPWHP